MLKAIIFDADGTLYDINTKRAYGQSCDFLSEKTGIPAESIYIELKKTINRIKSSPNSSFDPEKRQRKYAYEKTLLRLGVTKEITKAVAQEAVDIFWNIVLEDLEMFSVVPDTLGNLAKKYDLAVTSEEFRGNLILKLNHAFGNWKKYFKILITPEETGTMKPSEKYYLKAMEKLNLNPDEIMAVGDSEERDIAPAKKLGIKSFIVSPKEFSKLMEEISEKK